MWQPRLIAVVARIERHEQQAARVRSQMQAGIAAQRQSVQRQAAVAHAQRRNAFADEGRSDAPPGGFYFR